MVINKMLWAFYALFVALALYLNWHAELFSFSGNFAAVKIIIWAVYLVFLAYSIQCSFKESLFRTIGKMKELYWGTQIGLDLYIGVGLALLVVFLNEGALVFALWLIPFLVFANLAVLLYFAIHFESIVSKLMML